MTIQRITSNVLRDWTNRVADVKFRELETVQEYERRIVSYVHSFIQSNNLIFRDAAVAYSRNGKQSASVMSKSSV
jgi:hypothetical protein